MNESLNSSELNTSASANFEFNGATVYLVATNADQLLADLAKFGKGGICESAATDKVAKTAKTAKPTALSAAEKSAVAAITAEQAAAVDDTAGLEEVNKPKAEPVAEVKKAPTIEYTVLQKAVFALASISRDAVIELAASFGVKSFKELDAGRWDDALTAVNAKVEELKSVEVT